MKNIILPLILFVAISIHAGHHEETKVAAQGMISSEVFNLKTLAANSIALAPLVTAYALPFELFFSVSYYNCKTPPL